MALDPSLLDTFEKQERKQAQKYVTDVAKAAQTAGVACETYVTKPAGAASLHRSSLAA
jgi:hypothetical protein